MGYADTEILRDKNGDPIPQVYDSVTGKFVPAALKQITADAEVLEEIKKITALFKAYYGEE